MAPTNIDSAKLRSALVRALAKKKKIWRPTLLKYDEDQPRNAKGEFASSDSKFSGPVGSSGARLPSMQQLNGMNNGQGPLGSNGGTWRKSEDGTQYLIKPTNSAAHAFNEIAAGAVYHVAGVPFPNTGVVHDAGKWYVVSEKIEGLQQQTPAQWRSNQSAQSEAAKNFGVDALLSHWDVHGLSADNTLINAAGTPVRIESGGAMAFRAMGGTRDSFNSDSQWKEPQSMRTSAQGSLMYGNMTDKEAATSLERAASINLKDVQKSWDASGVPRNMSSGWMKTLTARQAQIPPIVAKLNGSA